MNKKKTSETKQPTRETNPPASETKLPARETVRPALGPGIQLPAGVVIQPPPPPFPPDLERQLQEAQRDGSYFIVVVRADQHGTLACDSYRSGKFNPDWLLRAWRGVADDILAGKLSSPTEPQGDH